MDLNQSQIPNEKSVNIFMPSADLMRYKINSPRPAQKIKNTVPKNA